MLSEHVGKLSYLSLFKELGHKNVLLAFACKGAWGITFQHYSTGTKTFWLFVSDFRMTQLFQISNIPKQI